MNHDHSHYIVGGSKLTIGSLLGKVYIIIQKLLEKRIQMVLFHLFYNQMSFMKKGASLTIYTLPNKH
jgi:hypothetical protein